MKCTLCEKFINDIEKAIENDWIPNFWCREQEYGPVCPHCAEKYLQFDVDGELAIKSIFVKTFLDSSSSTRIDLPLDEVPAATSIYPDRELIKRLRKKFIEGSIDDFTTEEIIDLINHQNQLILDLDRGIENLIVERDEAYADF